MTLSPTADRLLGQDLLVRAPNDEERRELKERLDAYHEPHLIEVRSSGRFAGLLGWRGKGLWIEIEPAHRRRGRGRIALALWLQAVLDEHDTATILGPISAIAEDFLRRFRFRAEGSSWVDTPETRTQLANLFAQDESRYIQRTHMTLLEMGIPPDWPAQAQLPLCLEPRSLKSVGLDMFDREQWLRPDAAAAWESMRRAAADDGVTLQLVSGFRSFDYQVGIIRRKIEDGQSLGQIMSVSAAPGYSEHHTGCAVDIGTPESKPLEEEFAKSAAFEWLTAQAADYGFTLSYPKDNPHGVAYEPWHWMYRGAQDAAGQASS